MKDGAEEFIVESTPVLDLKKHGLAAGATVAPVNEENWDSDRTEVYADVDGENAIASLIGEQGEQFPITTFPYVMGRGSECDLVLQGKGVSRRHAEIIFQSGRFVVNDLESLNGLKVNGYKVARVILEENDVIKLGDVGLTFRSGGGAATTSPAEGADKRKLTGLFARKEAPPAAGIEDDTFGHSPFKKVLTGGLLLVTLGLVGYAGFQYLLQQNQPAGRIVERTESAPAGTAASAQAPATNRAPAAEPAAAAPATASPANVADAGDGAVDPPPSISPPPSIARSAPVAPASTGVEDEPAPAVRQTPPAAVAAKPAAKPVAASRPPAAPAASSDLTRQAQAALVEADRQYFQGQAENALSRLKPLVDDGRVSESVRREVKTAYNNYSALYSQYVGGQAAFGRGDKEGAFQQWTAFMGKESSLFGGRKSSYTRSISTRVVDEYVSIGNEASRKGDHHSAYRNWQKALELGDSVAARIAIDSANNKAMQLYRQALRLEYVNTGKAKSLWQEVTELIPPGTEYNTKASAKLAWYDKWGA